MIIKYKHGCLEFLPNQDLPYNSNLSLKVFISAMLTFFALEGFHDFQK
jgi:hypothetical protein